MSTVAPRIRRIAFAILALTLATSAASAQVSIVMAYETTKKGKRVDKESGELRFAHDGEARYGMGMTPEDGGSVHVIFDPKAKKMTTVTPDSDGNLVAMRMPMIRVGTGVVREFTGEIERTEETRDILGYVARKFVVTDGGDVTETWIANVPGFSWQQFAGAVSGQGRGAMAAAFPELDEYPDAVALESHTVHRGGKKESHSRVTALGVGADADLTLVSVPDGVEVQDPLGGLGF